MVVLLGVVVAGVLLVAAVAVLHLKDLLGPQLVYLGKDWC